MLEFSLSLSAPDCCFTHTVKLAHGPARGRNAVHITCSTVCGCPDSSSSEPLRHHLLHHGEPNASPAMQPASLRSSTRTFGIFQRLCRWKVDGAELHVALRQRNKSQISHSLIWYLLCPSVVIFLRALTFPFIDWPSASQSLGKSCVFFPPSHSFYTESVLTLKAVLHSGTGLVE